MPLNTPPDEPLDLHVFGASDDLIELAGAIRDELSIAWGKPDVLSVTVQTDAGTQAEVLLEIGYDIDGTGEWRITPQTHPDLVTITPARGEDAGDDEHGCPGHSDRATIGGAIHAHLLSDEGRA